MDIALEPETTVTIDVEMTSQQLDLVVPINAIRVETLISGYPFHWLAKKGHQQIFIRNPADGSQIKTSWEITPSSSYGHPGSLAFKIDKLVVDRKIERAPKPLPGILRIGSLTDICKELELHEGARNKVKHALLQNAFAGIRARILHRDKTGRERTLEIAGTRYSVIFTGDTMPDGTRADAVYIQLNGWYRDILNTVSFRPLDYDYLRTLPPAPQRLYELLSRQIYGSLAGRRARAKLLYSDYCSHAPQKRYPDWDHVKKQMYKLHAPHLKSGYLAKVEFEKTEDRNGQPDWEMLYTPGPKARAEFRTFTKNQLCPPDTLDLSAAGPQAAPTKSRGPAQQTLALKSAAPEVDENLLAEITRRRVSEREARKLLLNLRAGQDVAEQIEWYDYLLSTSEAAKFRNPPGFLRCLIEDNLAPPPDFESTRKRATRQALEREHHHVLMERQNFQLLYDEYRETELDRYIAENVPAQDYQRAFETTRAELKNKWSQLNSETHDQCARQKIRDIWRDRAPLMSFEEFSRRQQGIAHPG